MSEDLKLIKKLYGEAMMHFCRDYFSTILDKGGLLSKILQDNFAPSHNLYNDLINEKKIDDFKNYIYDLFYKKDKNIEVLNVPTPQELMRQAGYVLYECKTERDIQAFKKYYAKGEELCTFNGGRLNICYVFFAVKENVDEINRVDFSNPQRQDHYGTSVISIQFLRDSSHTLSIKNRYNHRVDNPDATFGNNLDNIIEGLTESFAEYYGLKQKHINDGFELPGYVRANDGRWYKYNYEINNIYYCPDNVIIDKFSVKKYEKEKFIVFDYFILDLVGKRIYLSDKKIKESLPDVIGKINRILVVKKGEEKEISIINEKGEEVIIVINKNNQMVGLKSKDIKQAGDNFLEKNTSIKSLELPSLQQVGDYFLANNAKLIMLSLPNLKLVGNSMLLSNVPLSNVDLPLLQQVGDYFLASNRYLKTLNLPKLQYVGDHFLCLNRFLEVLGLPELQIVGNNFLGDNIFLMVLYLPKLIRMGDNFCHSNLKMIVDLPSLQQFEDFFLPKNDHLRNQLLEQIERNQGMKK